MFKERLCYLIKTTKINQRKLAEFLGYSPQAINSWCNGMSEPDSKTIIKIANYFNISTDFLLGNNEKPDLNSPALQCEALKNALVDVGYIEKNENFHQKDFEYLIDYISTNKKFIKK